MIVQNLEDGTLGPNKLKTTHPIGSLELTDEPFVAIWMISISSIVFTYETQSGQGKDLTEPLLIWLGSRTNTKTYPYEFPLPTIWSDKLLKLCSLKAKIDAQQENKIKKWFWMNSILIVIMICEKLFIHIAWS